MTKITIERETLEQVLECLVQEGRSLRAAEVREALEQKEEPPAPSQGKSLALLDLDSVEHMQGGANGPTIRLRGFINAQTGPTAPQPPIDNAFVAEGCEQFSPPSEPAPVPCCGKYETCSHACTPRGRWLGRREGRRVLAIVPPGYVLVPIEPTPEMIATGAVALMKASDSDLDATREEIAATYRAMIAAAGDKP